MCVSIMYAEFIASRHVILANYLTSFVDINHEFNRVNNACTVADSIPLRLIFNIVIRIRKITYNVYH